MMPPIISSESALAYGSSALLDPGKYCHHVYSQAKVNCKHRILSFLLLPFSTVKVIPLEIKQKIIYILKILTASSLSSCINERVSQVIKTGWPHSDVIIQAKKVPLSRTIIESRQKDSIQRKCSVEMAVSFQKLISPSPSIRFMTTEQTSAQGREKCISLTPREREDNAIYRIALLKTIIRWVKFPDQKKVLHLKDVQSPQQKFIQRSLSSVCLRNNGAEKRLAFYFNIENMCTCSEIDLHASMSFRTLCRFHFMRLFQAFLENDAVWDQSRRVTSAGYPTDLLGSVMCSVLQKTKHDVPVSKTTSITKPFGFVPYLRGISYNLKKTGIKYGTSDERSSPKS